MHQRESPRESDPTALVEVCALCVRVAPYVMQHHIESKG